MWGAMMMGGRQSSLSGQISCVNFGTHGQFNGYADGAAGGDSGGSCTPSLIGAYSIDTISDNITSNVGKFDLGGFASDPGAAFLESIKVGATTKFGVDADGYIFNSITGIASWSWTASGFGIPASGVTNWTIRLVG